MHARLASRTILAGSLIAGAFLLALVLRLRQAPAPMTFDEYASLYFSGRPFSELWGWWMLRETNPPLFYSILKLWRMVVPLNQPALRLLPLLFSLTQIGLVARFVGKSYGWLSALLCLLLFALSPSDIVQSEYVRGYVLAKLAVAVSFIGLVAALSDTDRPVSAWAAYAGGAIVAIYSHTTMLLWPAIATAAVFIEATWHREIGRARLARLLFANLAIVVLSSWVLWFAVVQMHTRAPNISWIEPLSLDDYAASLNLQLLMDGSMSSVLMAGLMVIGVLRTFRNRNTRLSLYIVVTTVLVFKAADFVHPVVSDYTLHWCANFTVILAAAALAQREVSGRRAWRWPHRVAAATTIVAVVAIGLFQLLEDVWISEPQDWRYTVKTVADSPNTALLVSHESVGLVVKQACLLEFHADGCPFLLVVMENQARSDSWAHGGYGGPVTPVRQVRAALGSVRTVYVFSRYVYTPLTQLGLDPRTYRDVQWDDGELFGPIPIRDFDTRR